MRRGRPRKLRIKKSIRRRVNGARLKGVGNPKQGAARRGRARIRRRKGY